MKRAFPGSAKGAAVNSSAIETVNNADEPTFWIGCVHCESFRGGVDPKYFKIARRLVQEREIIPYSHMDPFDYKRDPKKFEYYLEIQTGALSPKIRYIHQLLKEAENASPPSLPGRRPGR